MSRAESGDRIGDGITPNTESVQIRNYDTNRSHRVRLAVTDSDGAVFETTYRLRPGEVRSQVDALSAGTYDVEVEVDGRQRDVGRCRVEEAYDRTILIETGNGVVSVTEGVY